MMSSPRNTLIQRALQNLVIKPFTPADFKEMLEGKRSDLFHASANMRDSTISGFKLEGAKAISELAKSVRESAIEKKRGVSARTLQTVIANELVVRQKDGSFASLSDKEFNAFGSAIDDWFVANNRVLRHLIPCAVIPEGGPRITLGPITLFPASEFRAEDYGVSAADSELHFSDLFQMMRERSANWIAEVEVTGREQSQSVLAANLAVDIALGGLQCALGSKDHHRIHRITGRAMPAYRVDIWLNENGLPGQASYNETPGLGTNVRALRDWITESKTLLDSIGNRISAYLSGSGATPRLDEAWCEAAYWYHEALAETLETVRIAKLETAMEVLFAAESTKQSNIRLIEAFESFFSIAQDKPIGPNTSITVKEFVASIVTARSRVLHGTWPTLSTDVPNISFESVHWTARNLLLLFTLELDRYQKAAAPKDDTSSFLNLVAQNKDSRPT